MTLRDRIAVSLLAAGALILTAGVALVAGVGWSLVTAGACTIGLGLLVVFADDDTAATPNPGGTR